MSSYFEMTPMDPDWTWEPTAIGSERPDVPCPVLDRECAGEDRPIGTPGSPWMPAVVGLQMGQF